jgi:NADPH-dependent curcumin reductase CurA
VLVTTGSQDKVDFCIRLGASQGFNYKDKEAAPE